MSIRHLVWIVATTLVLSGVVGCKKKKAADKKDPTPRVSMGASMLPAGMDAMRAPMDAMGMDPRLGEKTDGGLPTMDAMRVDPLNNNGMKIRKQLKGLEDQL